MPKNMALEIVPRAKWGAVQPKAKGTEMEHPIEYIWMRSEPEMRPCFTLEECKRALQQIQKRDMEAPNCIDINANFIFGDDKRVYEGRGFLVKPRKSEEFPKYDGEYIELIYIGPFDDMPAQRENQLLSVIEKFLYKGYHKQYLGYTPEFLGFAKDYIHTPEQYVEPDEEEVFTKAGRPF